MGGTHTDVRQATDVHNLSQVRRLSVSVNRTPY